MGFSLVSIVLCQYVVINTAKGIQMTWTTSTLSSTDDWNCIAYGNGQFVTIANASIASSYSSNGITWTGGNVADDVYSPYNVTTHAYWQDVIYAKDRFVAISIGFTSASSIDGVRWNQRPLPYSKKWQGIAYGQNFHITVGSGYVTKFGFPHGNQAVAVTPDPHDWSSSVMDTSLPWVDVAFGNTKFIAIAANTNAVSTSTHGASWITSNTLPVTQNWSSIIYGNNAFVAVATGSSTATYSNDGITWTATTLPAAQNWVDIAYGNNQYVAIASNSSMAAVSADGVTWTASIMPVDQDWSAIAYGENKFIAVANNSNTAAILN